MGARGVRGGGVGAGGDEPGDESNCAGSVPPAGAMVYTQDMGELELPEDNAASSITKEREQEKKLLIRDHRGGGGEGEEEKSFCSLIATQEEEGEEDICVLFHDQYEGEVE